MAIAIVVIAVFWVPRIPVHPEAWGIGLGAFLAACTGAAIALRWQSPGAYIHWRSRLSNFGMVMLAPLYAFLVIPVWAAATEYPVGQVRMALTATPRRTTLALAKLVATVIVVLTAGIIAIVPARITICVAHGLNAAELAMNCIQWVTVYVLISLIAYGLAGMLRGTVAPLRRH